MEEKRLAPIEAAKQLKIYDETFVRRFVEAFDIFYKRNEKEKFIELVDLVLKPFDGRLFGGFSIGKE